MDVNSQQVSAHTGKLSHKSLKNILARSSNEDQQEEER